MVPHIGLRLRLASSGNFRGEYPKSANLSPALDFRYRSVRLQVSTPRDAVWN